MRRTLELSIVLPVAYVIASHRLAWALVHHLVDTALWPTQAELDKLFSDMLDNTEES
jgi:hypothetical protein